jgi:sugar lactone lactonase YvrE
MPFPAHAAPAATGRDGDFPAPAVFGAKMRQTLLRPARPLLTALAAIAALWLTAEPAAACPGAVPSCPYSAVSQVGQRGGGVLRFPQAIAIGPDGSVHVGDQGSRTVQVFAPDGTFLREVGSAGTRPGELSGVGALAVAGDGSLLVADGANRIVRFAADGALLRTWGRSGSEAGAFRFGGGRGNDAGAGGGLAVGGNVVYVADSGNNRVQRFSLDGDSGGVIVPPGTLAYPKGLAVRGNRLFVADNQNHRVLVMDTGGRLLREIRTDASVGRGRLSHPYGVTADPAGRVFVADNMNHRVVRFSTAPTYPYKGRWGAYGTEAGRLAYPRALASDGQGNLYVANTGNDRVDVYDHGGRLLRSFGSSGRATGQFNTPLGVAADGSGLRAVADSVNGRIQFLAPDGSIASAWGSPAPGPTILPRPVAVAFDGGGNAFVLDQRRARIVVFSRETGLPARTIASQGSGPGQLLDPSALTIDVTGTISVADTGNRRIARFAADGTYLGAITGTGPIRGIAVTPDGSRIYSSGDRNRIAVHDPAGALLDWFGGTGSKLGKLNTPAQITLDGAGNLWVADRGNHRVQQFGPDGERLAAFGERGTGAGQFLRPTGVSVDCRGGLTVTDTDNNRVQQFALTAPAPSTCAALPALGTPPPPKLPTLPQPDGPQVTLKALRSGGVLTARTVPFRVGCDTACSVTATLAISPRSKPPRGRKRVTVRLRAKAELAAGESTIVRLALSRRQAASLGKALRGRRGLEGHLGVVATAAVGEPTDVTSVIQLTR